MGNLKELSQSPELLVRGSFRQTPLAEFLIQAYDSGLEGTLLLQTLEREKSAILFIRGAPAKARPARNAIYLGDVATELGLVETSVSRSTRQQADEEQRTHGSVLRELGYLDESSLYVALREQLFRQVLALADLPDTTGFGFYRANYLADWGDKGQWRVKPLPMIWRTLVDHMPDARREAWLRRLGDTPLHMRREAPVSRYHLSPEEKNLLDVLRAKAMSVSNLMNAGVGTPELVRKVACALLLSRQVEVGTAKEPVGLREPPETSQSVLPPENRGAKGATPRPGRLPAVAFSPGFSAAPQGESLPPGASLPPDGSVVKGHSPAAVGAQRSATPGNASAADEGSAGPVSTSSPRRSLTPVSRRTGPGRSAEAGGGGSLRPATGRPSEELEDIRAEIEAYRERHVHDYYETLCVERKADAATIRSAFFQLAKRWHPDRLPSELADLKPFVTKAFAAMGEAHQTLIDETRRAEYDRTLKEQPEGDEQAQVVAILDAASAFQRAEILLKKKDLKGAFEQAKLAYEGDPTQADHAALYAWVKGQQRSEGFDDLIKMLDAAIKADGANIRAFWYRGQLYKKAGEEQKAIRDFKKIIQLKPNHVDAQRELRVYSMRKRSDPSAGGLFGRFKKKE